MKALDCPKCGAELHLDPLATFARCKYCGTESRVEGEGDSRHLIEIASRLVELNEAVSKSAKTIEAIRFTQLDEQNNAKKSANESSEAGSKTDAPPRTEIQSTPARWDMRAIGARVALGFQSLVLGGMAAVLLLVAIDPNHQLGRDSRPFVQLFFALLAMPLFATSVWKALLATSLHGRYLRSLQSNALKRKAQQPSTKQWLADQLRQANARAERMEAKLSKVTRPTQPVNIGCGGLLVLMVVFCALARSCGSPQSPGAAAQPSTGQSTPPGQP